MRATEEAVRLQRRDSNPTSVAGGYRVYAGSVKVRLVIADGGARTSYTSIVTSEYALIFEFCAIPSFVPGR